MIQSVDILIRDGAGRTVLQMRDGKARTAPLCWGFWGGAFDVSDGTAERCAAREVAEELSIDLLPGDFLQVAERRRRDGRVAPLLLLRRPLEWKDIGLNEGAGAARFWRSEMLLLPLAPAVAWYLERHADLFAEACCAARTQ